MACFRKLRDAEEIVSGHGHGSFPLLGEAEGCANECAAGISYYKSTEYTPPAVHEFQEGFIVLSGSGYVKIGEEEFFAEKNTAFLAGAGQEHRLKSADRNEPLTVFWFHAKA